MKEKFNDERFELRKAIKHDTREHEHLETKEVMPEFDDLEYKYKAALVELAEEEYGKKWIEEEQHEREEVELGRSQLKEPIHQFDFTHNHKANFEKLIPTEECDTLRPQIRMNFEKEARESIGTTRICC